MRKNVQAVCAILTLFAVLALPFSAQAGEGKWKGWITDEKCGAAGANAEHKECALECHEQGEALVLYNTADEKLYKLSDQEMAKANLGYPVVVAGTMDDGMITVASIQEKKEHEHHGHPGHEHEGHDHPGHDQAGHDDHEHEGHSHEEHDSTHHEGHDHEGHGDHDHHGHEGHDHGDDHHHGDDHDHDHGEGHHEGHGDHDHGDGHDHGDH